MSLQMDQGWKPSIPMATQTCSNLGKVTEIIQAWELQIVVFNQCCRAVPTKTHTTPSLGTTQPLD